MLDLQLQKKLLHLAKDYVLQEKHPKGELTQTNKAGNRNQISLKITIALKTISINSDPIK